MKCDLCQQQPREESLLCASCAEMIRRLLTIDDHKKTRETCEAQRLAKLPVVVHSIASGQS